MKFGDRSVVIKWDVVSANHPKNRGPQPRRTALLTAFLALLLIACASGAAIAGTKAEHPYLLAGTPTPDSASGFPVRLYSVSAGRLVLVRQIAAGLFSVANDLSRHLYVLDVGLRVLNVIHENAAQEVDAVPAPPQPKGRFASFSFYYPTWGAIDGRGVRPGIVYARGNGPPAAWTVTRIFVHAPRGKGRIARGSWYLYRYFRYRGPGGGPYGQPTAPAGTIEDHRIMMPLTLGPGAGYMGPTPPFLPPEAGAVAGYPDRPRGAGVIADTARFFVLGVPLTGMEKQWPKEVYALNKATGHWKVIGVPFIWLSPRVFGPWIATLVEEPNTEGRVSPGLKDERAHEVDVDTPTGQVRELPRIRGMYPSNVFMPGKLLLQNLVDGQRLTIDTGQQDSEILDVRKDGLVLYRVNDEIFSAKIEGDKLSAPRLLVKGEDVPEVHWVFWSKADTERQVSAANVRTLFAQLKGHATSSKAEMELTKLGRANSATREYVSEHLPKLIETSGGVVRMNAIELAGNLKVKSTIPALVPFLRYFSMVGSTEFAVTARLGNDPVAKALAQIGEPSVEPVAQVLEQGNKQARWRAARILFHIGSPTAIQALRSYIPKEKDPHLKQFIASHLRSHGTESW